MKISFQVGPLLFMELGFFLFLSLGTVACASEEGEPSSLGSTPAAQELPLPDPVVARDGRLFDDLGREIVLRGFNARVEGLFDVTFDDGRIALQVIPPFTPDDCGVIANELGQNFLRLPVNWSGIEKERGVYNEVYLNKIVELVRGCWEHGVYTLVDIHQDAYSKHIGEDGAPLWAILPPPEVLLEGPLTEEELAKRRMSPEVLAAFESLFNNVDGIQDDYAKMAARLARLLDGEPGVMGLELMNEPVVLADLPGNDQGILAAFHDNVARAIRDVAPEMTLVFEPNSLRNFLDVWEVTTPFPFEDAVYSPHVYTDVFTDGWASQNIEKLRGSIAASQAEAEEHGAPLLIGEYGNSPKTETGQLWLSESLKMMDEVGASGAVWLYEEWSQGGWGLYSKSEDGERGDFREEFARLIARPFPQAVDGRLEGFTFDAESLVLTVEIGDAGTGEHVLASPNVLYPQGVVVRCDGETVNAAVLEKGRVSFPCQGTTLTLSPGDQ